MSHTAQSLRTLFETRTDLTICDVRQNVSRRATALSSTGSWVYSDRPQWIVEVLRGDSHHEFYVEEGEDGLLEWGWTLMSGEPGDLDVLRKKFNRVAPALKRK
jgi:hypothetical protein